MGVVMVAAIVEVAFITTYYAPTIYLQTPVDLSRCDQVLVHHKFVSPPSIF